MHAENAMHQFLARSLHAVNDVKKKINKRKRTPEKHVHRRVPLRANTLLTRRATRCSMTATLQ